MATFYLYAVLVTLALAVPSLFRLARWADHEPERPSRPLNEGLMNHEIRTESEVSDLSQSARTHPPLTLSLARVVSSLRTWANGIRRAIVENRASVQAHTRTRSTTEAETGINSRTSAKI